MDEVLAYSTWLKVPSDIREKVSKLLGIPKTGSVNVETRANSEGSYSSVVTRDGHTPDDLRAITVPKMQAALKTEETDFYVLAETVFENVDALLDGTYEPFEKPTSDTEIQNSPLHVVEKKREERKAKNKK